MHLRTLAAPAVLAVAAACASGRGTASGANPEATVMSAGLIATYSWSGNLQPTQTRSGDASAPSSRNRAFGTVKLTAAADDPRRTRAQIDVNFPTRSPVELRWALVPGRCGSQALPLVGYEVYPQIEVSNTGRGTLNVTIPVTLPTEGSYHVNVYRGGQQVSDVITCSNLRMDSK